MPSVRTIVKDFHHGSVVGVRQPILARGGEAVDIPLAEGRSVATCEDPALVSVTAVAPVLLDIDASSHVAANAMYLFFKDATTTVTTLTRAIRVAVGGNYAGCLYSVYHAGRGVFKCCHTARPLDPNTNLGDDTYVQRLSTFAFERQWSLVHQVPTVGCQGVAGYNGVFIVTRVHYNINPVEVRTIRLSLDRQMMVVAHHRVITPVQAGMGL
jgi:hypothetical protein